MKTSELRELSGEDLVVRLAEAREELFNLRFQNATGRLDNYKRLQTLRREVARIETIIRESELGIQRASSEESEAPERPRRRLFRHGRTDFESGSESDKGSIASEVVGDEVNGLSDDDEMSTELPGEDLVGLGDSKSGKNSDQ